MRIIHHKVLNATEAVPFAAAGWVELMNQGRASNDIMLSWDDEALVAKDYDQVIGVMTFNYNSWQRIVFIKLGYVAPSFRRQGIYKQMFEMLVQIAKGYGAAAIEGATGISNDGMRAVNDTLGRKEKAIIYTYPVPG